MTFINFSILSGLLLATIPVVLHMVMRAKPKRIEFPALRLLKARQPSNARRMQLRHLLLLLLRACLIVALVIAVARPSLPAARYGLRWWEWLSLGFVTAAAFGVYQWLSHRDRNSSLARHQVRERRSRHRIACVFGGILASIIAVGLPWGVRVRGELLSPRNEATEDIPVAVVFVFDTSISMNYRHENLTRLEKARQVAAEYLGQLPSGSRVAVAGLDQEEEVVFQADLAGAQSRMDSLELTTIPESLNARLKDAVQSHIDDRQRVREELGISEASDLFAREVCLLTDGSLTAWKHPDESGLSDLLKVNDWIQLYLIDIGVAQPNNISLANMELSEESSAAGRPLQLNVTVQATTAASPQTMVETYLINPDGSEVRVGAPRSVKIDTGAVGVSVELQAPEGQPFANGFVRIASSDPLPDDSIRYFSFGIRNRPRVLMISDREEETYYLKNVLQPDEADRLGWQFYDCTRTTTLQASQYSFSDFDVVCVVNSADPDASLWTALLRFAENGGGVFICTGAKGIQPNRWDTVESQRLLPAQPIVPVRYLDEPSVMKIVSEQHAVTRKFASDDEWRTELSRALFDRCWAVELHPEASVLMQYDGIGDRPALLERRVGSGRCLMFTSALDNLVNGGSDWNNLVVENWSFIPLADSIMQYLIGATDQVHNFVAGRPVEIQVPPSQRFGQYLLRRPEFRQTRAALPADQTTILISDADDAGHYQIRPFESTSPFLSSFSVNLRDDESNLNRLPPEQLNEILGEDRYATVSKPEDLLQVVRVGRLGIEVFPVLMGLLVLLFIAESLMANYFYDEDPAQRSPAASVAGPEAAVQA
ncbi:MAG: BatA domain-containing protein [Planctomycetaceae bacterium]|nr:BatA domain-containing protein [Planctomycetaceae bacterium]